MIYSIGDVHGQLPMLEAALELIEKDGGPDARIVFVGDYTDRGPDSRGVVERLYRGITEGRNWVAIKGNHDHMFSHFVRTGEAAHRQIKSGKTWLHPALGGQRTLGSYLEKPDPGFLHPANGGAATLLSYEVEISASATLTELQSAAHDAVPEAHLAFLEGLPLWHDEGPLRFVHAGIRPGIAMDAQEADDLMWIRDGFLEDTRDHGPLIVHGHTALQAPEAYPNRVNLDGGAGYGRPLEPAVFEGRDCFLLTPQGRVPLRPAEP